VVAVRVDCGDERETRVGRREAHAALRARNRGTRPRRHSSAVALKPRRSAAASSKGQ
jgi:hypothetical protein